MVLLWASKLSACDIPTVKDLKPKINLKVIAFMESSNNPKAFNRKNSDSGLYQITPIVLYQFNNNSNCDFLFEQEDLFNPKVNEAIAVYQLNWLASKKLSVSEILIAWNWGYGNLLKWKRGLKSLPPETDNYVAKYFKLAGKNDFNITPIR